jgi:hypothetical protein
MEHRSAAWQIEFTLGLRMWAWLTVRRAMREARWSNCRHGAAPICNGCALQSATGSGFESGPGPYAVKHPVQSFVAECHVLAVTVTAYALSSAADLLLHVNSGTTVHS